MNEYIFFDADLRDRFVAYVKNLGIECEQHDDNMGLLVAVSDDLADELTDALEIFYDQLETEQTALLSQSEGGFKNLAGFGVTLPDGQARMVPVPTDVANRLLSNFSIEEIHALFSGIAASVLSPNQDPLCKVMHADEKSAK